jgi:signal transduction histidine kinase
MGFDVRASRLCAAQNVGVGLQGMDERVRLIDGRLDIRSAPGHGTEIHMWAPLNHSTPP